MLSLNVVTPNRSFLQVECLSISLPGRHGQLEILPGHAPFLADLSEGIITLHKADNEVVRFMIASGFLEVDGDQVNVLCEQARYKSEIDREQESRLVSDLHSRLKGEDESVDDDSEHKNLSTELAISTAKLSLFE